MGMRKWLKRENVEIDRSFQGSERDLPPVRESMIPVSKEEDGIREK